MNTTTSAQADVLDVIGDRLRVIADGSETEGRFEVFDVEGDEGSGPPPHAHPWTESFYILDGTVEVTVDDKTTLAWTGMSIIVPENVVHTFRVATPTARFITVTSGGQASGFFRDLSAQAPGAPTDTTLPIVVEVAKKHGLTSPLFP